MEFIDLDANRDAGAAILASRAVGYGLRPAKPGLGELIIQRDRAAADQMGKDLPLLAVRQIGARRRSGQIELRCVARLSRQARDFPSLRFDYEFARLARSSGPAKTKTCLQVEERRVMMTPENMSCRHLLSFVRSETRKIGGNIQLT